MTFITTNTTYFKSSKLFLVSLFSLLIPVFATDYYSTEVLSINLLAEPVYVRVDEALGKEDEKERKCVSNGGRHVNQQ